MSTFEWVRAAYETLKKAGHLDYAENLMSLREDMLELRETSLNLKEENKKLKDQLTFNGKVKFEKGICWIEDDEMTAEDTPTPICPQCYQVKMVTNRLSTYDSYGTLSINCKECGKTFSIR